MRRILCVLILLILSGQYIHGQEELNFGGVAVRVGMAQEEVLTSLKRLSYKVGCGENDVCIVYSGNVLGGIGTIAFREGKVFAASRTLRTFESPGALELTEYFILLIDQLQQQGNRSASIKVETNLDPTDVPNTDEGITRTLTLDFGSVVIRLNMSETRNTFTQAETGEPITMDIKGVILSETIK